MAKELYLRVLNAGRLNRLVLYPRVMPHDAPAIRAAKSAASSKGQKYINLKNAAEKLEGLLYANFDIKHACFCTFTFTDENLPVNRKMMRVCFTAFLSAMRRKWKKKGKPFPYIYVMEGASLSLDPTAIPAEQSTWEIRPWEVTKRWQSLDQPQKSGKRGKREMKNTRFHIHAFLVLTKEERELIRSEWKYGLSFLNPMRIDIPETFRLLSYYVTKEARSDGRTAGQRSYIPSKGLVQPKISWEWVEAYTALAPPPGVHIVEQSPAKTAYNEYQYLTYIEPRKKRPKIYHSKGRL